MKFKIETTKHSYCRDETSLPCEGAKREQLTGGANRFVIEIGSLEELLDVSRRSGHSIIVDPAEGRPDGLPSIEIYNDYRE